MSELKVPRMEDTPIIHDKFERKKKLARTVFNRLAKTIVVDQQGQTKMALRNASLPTALLFFGHGKQVHYIGSKIFKMKAPAKKAVMDIKERFILEMTTGEFNLWSIKSVPTGNLLKLGKGIIPIRQFFNECKS